METREEAAGGRGDATTTSDATRARGNWRPIRPVPADAPAYTTQWGHFSRGVPPRHWEYRDVDGSLQGVVCGFDASNGRRVHEQLSYCEGPKGQREWRYVAFAEPRPLYGLERLEWPATHPVIVVCDEESADAVHALLDGVWPVVTWSGGVRSWRMTDWAPLVGREVVLWPDNDAKRDKRTGALLPPERQPAVQAMAGIAERLATLGCTTRFVELADFVERPGAWPSSPATAIDEGWDAVRVLAFVSENLRPALADVPTRAARAVEPMALAPELDGGGGDCTLVWRDRQLVNCTQNVYALLEGSEHWRGVIAYDEFAQRTVKLRQPPYGTPESLGEWESHDDSLTAMWLARAHRFTPSSALVAEAVEVIAREHAFHPVRIYLDALRWDGTPRIDHWLTDLLGAAANDYTRLVARFFLIGMVKRVMEPGCKFDYCLVLEGRQGMFKSTALRVLGGPWFKDTDLDLQNKDAMTALQGAWLYEIAEMDSLTRAEASKQKSFLSRQVDEFRPVYGRREVRLPRQVVFAGTTNSWEWNKDPTGGRRFWPIEVADVDLKALAAQRDQLFAEALVEYRKGSPCYPDKHQQRELFDPEQLKRQQSESLVDALHDWVFARTADFSMAEAVADGLRLDYGKLTRDLQTRVGNALKALGCTRVERRNGTVRFWYRPPSRKAASSGLTHAQHDSGGAHEPLPI